MGGELLSLQVNLNLYKNSTRLTVLHSFGSDSSLFEGTKPWILGKFKKKTQCLERQWMDVFESIFYPGMSTDQTTSSLYD